MAFSPVKKTVFVHIPKTGGISIERSVNLRLGDMQRLYAFAGPLEMAHMTADMIRNLIGRGIYERCFVFAVVRNPFDRLVSEWAWKKETGDKRGLTGSGKTFEEFTKELHQKFEGIKLLPHRQRTHFEPQKKFVVDHDGNIIVDRILRFEKMSEVAQLVEERLGAKLPWVNKTDHENYQEYYTKELIEMVTDMYGQDLEHFGYEFGD